MEEEEIQGELKFRKKDDIEWKSGFATLFEGQLSIFDSAEKKRMKEKENASYSKLNQLTIRKKNQRESASTVKKHTRSSSFDESSDSIITVQETVVKKRAKRSASDDVFRQRCRSEYVDHLPPLEDLKFEEESDPIVIVTINIENCKLNTKIEGEENTFLIETEYDGSFYIQSADRIQKTKWINEIKSHLSLSKNSLDRARTSHCIPHKFSLESVFLKRCLVCRKLITEFKGLRCIHCNETSHSKCGKSVPPNCGLSVFKRALDDFHQKPDKKAKRITDSLTLRLKSKGESIFGVELEKMPMSEDGLPSVLTLCVYAVEKRGMDSVGIYRVSGVKSDVEKLKLHFSFGRPNLADCDQWGDINVITGVLKSWLRELPIPLLTFDFFNDFISLVRGPKFDVDKEELKKMVHSLPTTNYLVLKYLIAHLYRVTENSEVNRMQPENLGAIFGPTLLRDNQSKEESNLLNQQNSIVKHMIVYYQDIFEK